MARVDANGFLAKWGTRLGSAGPFITSGVNAVKTAPGQAAAAAADRWLAGIQQAAANGTFARNVAKVSLQDWKDAMISKGIPRLTQGIASAQKNKVGVITALLSAVDAAAAAANALPKGGLENGINRATAFMREMSARAPKKTGAA